MWGKQRCTVRRIHSFTQKVYVLFKGFSKYITVLREDRDTQAQPLTVQQTTVSIKKIPESELAEQLGTEDKGALNWEMDLSHKTKHATTRRTTQTQ